MTEKLFVLDSIPTAKTSYNRLQDFSQCRKNWGYSSLMSADHRERYKWENALKGVDSTFFSKIRRRGHKNKNRFAIASVVRLTLSRLVSRYPEGRTIEVAEAYFNKYWEHATDSDNYHMRNPKIKCVKRNASAKEMEALKKEALGYVKGFFNIINPEVLDVKETYFSYEGELGGIAFTGYADLIVRDKKGMMDITIYKIGKIPPPLYKSKALKEVEQLAAALEEGGEKVGAAKLLYLPNAELGFNRKGEILEADLTQDSMARIAERYVGEWRKAEAAFKHGALYASPSAMCKFCPYLDACQEGQTSIHKFQ